MSFADLASPADLMALFGHYRDLVYPLLFLGAFFETLIPFSFFVYGEIFFLTGALLAGTGRLELWAVAAVLYAGGILGDNASYWFGRYHGLSLISTLSGWPLIGRVLHHNNYRKGIDFFQRRGALAVFSARLAGPLSWVVPACAGAFRLNYPTFVLFNTLGVFIGIGEFLVLGYFLGSQADLLLHWLHRLGYVPLALLCIALALTAWRCRPPAGR